MFVDWKAAGCDVLGDVPTLSCIIPVVASIVQIAFFFLGTVVIIFLIWGALQFVLSSGDQKAVQKAKNTMTYAIIGVVLVFLSFLAMNFINDFLGLPKGTLLNFGFNQAPPGP